MSPSLGSLPSLAAEIISACRSFVSSSSRRGILRERFLMVCSCICVFMVLWVAFKLTPAGGKAKTTRQGEPPGCAPGRPEISLSLYELPVLDFPVSSLCAPLLAGLPV